MGAALTMICQRIERSHKKREPENSGSLCRALEFFLVVLLVLSLILALVLGLIFLIVVLHTVAGVVLLIFHKAHLFSLDDCP